MTLDPRVIDAQNTVEAKRAQLMTSIKYGVGEAKRRLAPDLVADQVWEATKEKIHRGSHDAVVAAKNSPWIVGGVGAAIGLFLARGAISDLVRGGIEKVADWRTNADDEGETTPVADRPRPDKNPETPVAVARQAKRRKAGAAANHSATRKIKTENVK